MMILKKGVGNISVRQCRNCNTVFSFNKDDIVSTSKYKKIGGDKVECPSCHKNVAI